MKMNRQEIKEQWVETSNEFKSGLSLINSSYHGLELLVGGEDAYKELGSPAACITQIDKPFIFLADSKILSRFGLTKNEVKAILYHEQGHYELGHTDIDYAIDTDKMDNELYEKKEFDADAKAIEIAVRYGANADDTLLNLAMALNKCAAYITEECLWTNQLPSESSLDFVDRRVERLVNRLSNKDAYTKRVDKLKKHSFKALLKIAKCSGFSSLSDMTNSIEEKYQADEDEFFSNFNMSDIDLNAPILESDIEDLIHDLDDDIEDDTMCGLDVDMDKVSSILDDIWSN